MSVFQDITNRTGSHSRHGNNRPQKSSSSMARVFESSEESTPPRDEDKRSPQIVGGQASLTSTTQSQQKSRSLVDTTSEDLRHEVLGIQRAFQRSNTLKEKNQLMVRFDDAISRIFSQPIAVQNKLVPFLLRLHETELIVQTCDQIMRYAKNMKSNFVETAKILLSSSGGLFRLCQDATRFKRFSKNNQSIKPVQCIKTILSHVRIADISSNMIVMAQIHPQWECQILQFLRHLFAHSTHLEEIEETNREQIIQFMSKMLCSTNFECRRDAKRCFKTIHKKMPILAQELASEVNPRWLPKVSSGPNFEDTANVKLGPIQQRLYQQTKTKNHNQAVPYEHLGTLRLPEEIGNREISSSLDVSASSGEASCDVSMHELREPKEGFDTFETPVQTTKKSIGNVDLSDGELVERFTPKPHMTRMSKLAALAAKENSPPQLESSSSTSTFEPDQLASPKALPEEEDYRGGNGQKSLPQIAPLPNFSPNSQISAITAQLAQVNAILASTQTQKRPEFDRKPSSKIDTIGKHLASVNAVAETSSELSETLSQASTEDGSEICLVAHDSGSLTPCTPVVPPRNVFDSMDSASAALTSRGFADFLEDYVPITPTTTTNRTPSTSAPPKGCNLLTLLEGSSEDASVTNSPDASIEMKTDEVYSAVSSDSNSPDKMEVNSSIRMAELDESLSSYSGRAMCCSVITSVLTSILMIVSFVLWLSVVHDYVQSADDLAVVDELMFLESSPAMTSDAVYFEHDLLWSNFSTEIVSESDVVDEPATAVSRETEAEPLASEVVSAESSDQESILDVEKVTKVVVEEEETVQQSQDVGEEKELALEVEVNQTFIDEEIGHAGKQIAVKIEVEVEMEDDSQEPSRELPNIETAAHTVEEMEPIVEDEQEKDIVLQPVVEEVKDEDAIDDAAMEKLQAEMEAKLIAEYEMLENEVASQAKMVEETLRHLETVESSEKETDVREWQEVKDRSMDLEERKVHRSIHVQRANAIILVSLLWICGGSLILCVLAVIRPRLANH